MIGAWSEHGLVISHPPVRRDYFWRFGGAFCTQKLRHFRAAAIFLNVTKCMLCLIRQATLQHHQILRLPRKTTVQWWWWWCVDVVVWWCCDVVRTWWDVMWWDLVRGYCDIVHLHLYPHPSFANLTYSLHWPLKEKNKNAMMYIGLIISKKLCTSNLVYIKAAWASVNLNSCCSFAASPPPATPHKLAWPALALVKMWWWWNSVTEQEVFQLNFLEKTWHVLNI